MQSNAIDSPDLAPPDRRLNAYRPDLADIALKGRVKAAAYVPGRPMQVVVPAAPVRRQPRPDAALDTEALQGEAVSVFEVAANGWVWAQLQRDRYVGWLPPDTLGDAAPSGRRHGPDHRVCVPRTFLFPRPDIKSPPLAALPMGAAVTVVGTEPGRDTDFARIAPAGHVPVGHLAAPDAPPDRGPSGGFAAAPTDFVAVAEQFVGVPYLWGGKTLMGLDCSGLVQIAIQACGGAAPRDSDMQQQVLGAALDPAIDPAELRRGDLVFWSGHVGIMQTAADLLHANAHHMAVKSEPLQDMLSRMRKKGLKITGLRRIV